MMPYPLLALILSLGAMVALGIAAFVHRSLPLLAATLIVIVWLVMPAWAAAT